MSTLMDSVAGKGRNISTNFWIWLLIGSLLVFAGNTLYATTKASRLGGASTAASRLQLNSQRLANQGREAVAGDSQAFDAFKATKTEVDEDIKTLNDRFGDAAGVSGPIRTVSNTWSPLAKRADEVLASQAAVLGLAGHANSFTSKVPQLQAQLNEAQDARAQLEQQLEIQGTALQQESASLDATRSMLQTEQTRNAALNQACSDFDLRLKDRDEQIRSLEEKHLHARDALEHYRSATKEQREQDQRRHEGQLQQVQMELRQAQQSALVRQDEITQLHRDNERVLSESRALGKELNQANDLQHKLGNQNTQLNTQLSQLQSERTLLQERLRVATQESEGLKQAHAQIQESHAALSLRAIKAETALESLQELKKDAEQSVLTKDQ